MKNWNSTGGLPTTRRSRSRSSTGSRRHGDAFINGTSEFSHRDAMSHSQESLPGAASPKNTFLENYDAWIRVEAEAGRTRELKIWHHVQGRKFELWNLYEAVLEQGCPIGDLDWELVAQKIGIKAAALRHASEELEGCWDKYLSKFHEETYDFDVSKLSHSDNDNASTEGDDDSEGEHVSEDKVPSGRNGVSEDADVPSPRRSHPSPTLSDRPRPGSSLRKRRLDRRAEIPASPQPKERPNLGSEASGAVSSKRIRLSIQTNQQPDDASSDGFEDVDNSTPTHELSVPQDPHHRSPLSARTRGQGPASPHVSRARGNTRQAGTNPRPSTGEDSILQSGAAPVSDIGSNHTQHTNAGSIRTLVPHSTPERRALSPVIVPRAEPEPHPPIEADSPDEEDNSVEVQDTVEQFVREGYPRTLAVESLYRTSLVPSLARTVLVCLDRGDSVPDRAGVWTAQDDEMLRGISREDLYRPTENLMEQRRRRQMMQVLKDLVEKHGSENVEARRRFLVDATKAGLSL